MLHLKKEETIIYNSITDYLKANTPDLNIIIVHSQNNPKVKENLLYSQLILNNHFRYFTFVITFVYLKRKMVSADSSY